MKISKTIYNLVKVFENRIKNNIGLKEVNEQSLKTLKEWIENNK